MGAIIGPVDQVDSDLYHCSPLLSRPKDNHKRRIILNLSHPHGNSVNDSVPRDRFDGKHFTLRFPSVDTIVGKSCDLRDCDLVLYKIDVARAFRNIRVDAVDAVKLGIHWGVSACLRCNCLHNAMAWLRLSRLHRRLHSGGPCQQCKVPIFVPFLNPDKRVPPCKALTCLGIHIGINASSHSIDQAKLQSIHNKCLQVSAHKYLSKKRYQSLLGKLIYLHKCVVPARIFVNRILELFRNNFNKKKIHLTKDFFSDIAWFQAFLPHFNDTTRFKKPQVGGGIPLYLDASLTGIGAIWADQVYSAPVPCIPGFVLKIVHLEMWNIVIALRV